MCRCENPLSDKIREKISLFCNVPSNQVISVHDVDSIYRVPILLYEQNVVKILNDKLKLNLSTESVSDCLFFPFIELLPTVSSSIKSCYHEVLCDNNC